MSAAGGILRRHAPGWIRHLARRIRSSHAARAIGTELTYRLRRRRVERNLELARSLPRGLHLEATNICNARCVFCAYPQMQRPKSIMSMDRFEAIVDQYVEMGGTWVSLTPIVGDPFVDPLLFERLDHLAARPEIEGFYFFTNAILMRADASRRLMDYGRSLRICVSMGGFDRDTYRRIMGVDAFPGVWRNLETFIDMAAGHDPSPELELHVRCGEEALSGEAWNQARDWERREQALIAHIEEYDSWAGRIPAPDLVASGLRPARMPYKRGPCELLYMKPVVLADGRVNACACRDVEAELIVGDTTESSLTEIFEGEALEELRRRHRRGDFPDVCRRCTYYVSVFDPLRSRIAADELNWTTGFRD